MFVNFRGCYSASALKKKYIKQKHINSALFLFAFLLNRIHFHHFHRIVLHTFTLFFFKIFLNFLFFFCNNKCVCLFMPFFAYVPLFVTSFFNGKKVRTYMCCYILWLGLFQFFFCCFQLSLERLNRNFA